jgi:hypothetical protein
MELELTHDQRSQLELLSLHAGKTPAQALTEAALFLLEHDVDSWEWMRQRSTRSNCQTFLKDDELEARFSSILRR